MAINSYEPSGLPTKGSSKDFTIALGFNKLFYWVKYSTLCDFLPHMRDEIHITPQQARRAVLELDPYLRRFKTSPTVKDAVELLLKGMEGYKEEGEYNFPQRLHLEFDRCLRKSEIFGRKHPVDYWQPLVCLLADLQDIFSSRTFGCGETPQASLNELFTSSILPNLEKIPAISQLQLVMALTFRRQRCRTNVKLYVNELCRHSALFAAVSEIIRFEYHHPRYLDRDFCSIVSYFMIHSVQHSSLHVLPPNDKDYYFTDIFSLYPNPRQIEHAFYPHASLGRHDFRHIPILYGGPVGFKPT